jgi:hypothetical protein
LGFVERLLLSKLKTGTDRNHGGCQRSIQMNKAPRKDNGKEPVSVLGELRYGVRSWLHLFFPSTTSLSSLRVCSVVSTIILFLINHGQGTSLFLLHVYMLIVRRQATCFRPACARRIKTSTRTRTFAAMESCKHASHVEKASYDAIT